MIFLEIFLAFSGLGIDGTVSCPLWEVHSANLYEFHSAKRDNTLIICAMMFDSLENNKVAVLEFTLYVRDKILVQLP